MKEMLVIFGVIIVPLFLAGLFAVYKAHKTERRERTVEGGLYMPPGMTLDETSDAADAYCRENP